VSETPDARLQATDDLCPLCRRPGHPGIISDDMKHVLICARCARETADFFGAARERKGLEAQIEALTAEVERLQEERRSIWSERSGQGGR
jgi:hypothetical protein